MKRGRLSRSRVVGGHLLPRGAWADSAGRWGVGSHLSIASSREEKVWWENSGWSISNEGRKTTRGTAWDLAGANIEPVSSMCQIAELASYFDTRDLGAALATETGLGPVVVVLVDRMTRRVHSGLDE